MHNLWFDVQETSTIRERDRKLTIELNVVSLARTLWSPLYVPHFRRFQPESASVQRIRSQEQDILLAQVSLATMQKNSKLLTRQSLWSLTQLGNAKSARRQEIVGREAIQR